MEVVAKPVISFLVEKLSDELIQKAISLIGLHDQVEWIETELEWMQSFLKDADAEQQANERVKKWVRDVRGIAYDTEDVIDYFILKIEPLRQRRFLCSIKRCSFIHESIARLKITSKIKQIKLKVDDISKRRTAYGIEGIGKVEGASSAGRSLQEWRLTSPNVQEPGFVGFEKDLEALVVRLTEGELRRCVVSVVGMGGLGKTTLSKKVYNNGSVKKHFHTLAWISVTQEYTAKDLLQAIIKRWPVLSDKELEVVEKINVVELRDKISEYLNDKRYLVVLDDIWKGEAWDALKDAFPDKNNGSRIMLTTRNKDVALYADVRSQPHELRFLNNEESWELFCQKTFPGRNGGCPQELELGRQIVEKCHCLPLAIVVIGGLLSRKEPREWENIRKTISWQFVKGEVKIFGILSLSYNDLPHHLKACFLYLGNFPEDYEFHTRELIQMWAAEGLLQPRGEETLEEVGEDCLKELIQRSMVQVARRNSSRGIKHCRIHDLLRDLSISEAKECKFLEVHRGNMNAPSASTARRLAIHHNNLSCLSSSVPHLRSVLIYTQGDAWLQREQEKFLYRGFKLLRVLYLHGLTIEKLPREIGELIHLRYLGCTQTSLESLPSSIGSLPNLQTLSITSYHNIEVPGTIGKMQQLRHLQVKGVYKLEYLRYVGRWGVIEGHPRLEHLGNLQTLSYVKAGIWMRGCLGKLTNLRKLGIGLVMETDAEVLYESIANLVCLQSLSVVTLGNEFETIGLLIPPLSHLPKLSKLRLEGELEKLPESTEFPTNLTKLTLAWSHFKQDPLVTLENLKNLRIIRLLWSSYRGKEMACSTRGFPRLESLHLQGLHQLEEWRVEEGAMPSLLHLEINTCRNLKKLPEGLQHVTTLKKLELLYMPDEFRERLRENEGEDWQKIHHIPFIDMVNEIARNAYKGEEMSCSAHGFPLLEYLCSKGLGEVEKWRAAEASVPSPLHLWIDGCSDLKTLREGIQHVTTVKKLKFCSLHSEFKAMLREGRGQIGIRFDTCPPLT